MGQEIVYCYKCQRRILGADFAKGHAYQVGNQVSCSACAADLLHSLPVKEREQLMAKMFQATHGRASESTGSGTHERPKSTHRLPPVSSRPSAGSPGPMIAGVAVVAAVIVIGVVMMTGSKRPKPLPPPSPPSLKLAQPSAPPLPPAISAEEQRRIETARAALKRAREFSHANSNELKAQIQEWEKARAASEGTPFLEEAKRELAGLATRLQEQTAREQAEALNAGLIGYWKLDEGAGSSAGDSSPAGSFGTLKGTASWTSGRVGGAVAFEGAGGYISVPHREALNAFPISVCAWAKTSGLQGGIVNKYQSGSLLGYQIYLHQGQAYAWYFRNPENFVWDPKGTELGVGGGTVNDGAWHHLAFLVDKDGGRLYVDGVRKGAMGWTGTPGNSSSAKDLMIGRYPGRIDAPDSLFLGSIDEVRVYNRVLADEELRWLATPK